MADEWDRMLIPRLFQTAFTFSIGASYKGVEMLKSPQTTANKAMSELKTLLSVPEDAGQGLENKAKAVAAVWMERGATWMEACRETGNRFTEDEGDP